MYLDNIGKEMPYLARP